MPITVEVPNRGSIEFADGTSDADIDAIVSKEFPPTQEDSYQKVLGYEQLISDEVPTKEEFLAYSKVKKSKPLLGERPMETVGGAAVETAKFLATLPYRTGEAISETVIAPPEGVTRGEAVAGTAAEIAAQSKLGAERLMQGLQNFFADDIEKTASRLGIKLKSEDEKYSAFLQLADIKRKLAAAQNIAPEQRVPASQEFLQAYGIPQEAISPTGVEVGGFAAAPENIAFGVGGALASRLGSQFAAQIPRMGASLERAGAATGAFARMPETLAGRAATALTGSEAAGEAVQRAVATGTTGLTTAEAIGIPVSGTLGIPGIGAASQFISGTKAIGAVGETLGEAGAASGGAGLTPIQQGMLGFGERIAASPTASTAARRLGTAIARTGIETPVKTAANILIPGLGAGAAGGLLAGLTGEEGDNVAAAIGSGIAFGGIEGGIRLAKASAAKGFDNARVRQAVVEDLNTRPNDVQFTYVDPVAGDQTVTIKDRDARAEFYNKLKGEQLPKALSEIVNAENAGVEVLFHRDADPIPQGIQQIKYKGVALKPADVRGGRPTILINVDAASPETIPHELLHARLTDDIVRRAGANVVQDSFDAETGKLTQQGQQFQDFANAYANAIEKAGDFYGAAVFRGELATGFDNTLQRPQRIEALERLSDEMMAYYAQEFLAGKDPKTLLPGRIPSFWKNAFDLAKNAVADRFSQRALQAGFDPVARTFYDADGKRIKIPWMEDAINQLLVKGEGFIPKDQKVDLRGLTPAARSAVIIERGYADMFMVNPDGSMGRPLTAREVSIKDADIAQRTIQLLDSLPQADRASITGLDAKGNTIIEGRLSLKEAEALANSGIFSQSTSKFIKDIANAILNGDLLNGRYWKVYGKTGRAGVFPESEKAFLPYGISINSKGGVNIKIVDWTKVQSRMDKALKKAAYRNLFRSQEQAMSALRDVYLRNIAEQNAVPSAEALGGGADGARKRNFFNEVMGAVPKVGDVLINEPTAGYTASRKGGSVYEDLRIERVQDIEQTGTKIPWSGDMGEQSSYRRTQLNFQPAEKIGDASVQTDQNAGYRILSKNNKFRVYSPSGELAGIFDTEGQAKLKAEKLYATQTRLQPEIDQQQRQPRDEVRKTPEAGGRNRALSRTQGREEGGQELGQVRQAGDVGRFMPDQQGFYSKLEEVVTNKLPKSATPQQILATVDPAKGSGVKAEELKWTGFAQAVERIAKENGGKVPKEKLMEHLQNEGRVRFEEVEGGERSVWRVGDRNYTETYSSLQEAESARDNAISSLTDQILESWKVDEDPELGYFIVDENWVPLRPQKDDSGRVVWSPDSFYKTQTEAQKDLKSGAKEVAESLVVFDESTDTDSTQYSKYQLPGGQNYREIVLTSDTSAPYTSSHFEDIPNYVAHMRVNERAGPAGKPGLFIEEIQSDRHQQAREKGYEGEKAVPDAPFRKDWSLQMFKRGLRDAVASGKEWIGWTTGDTQAARYDLSKQVDYIDYRKVGTDGYDVSVFGKDGSELFSETGINQSRVTDVVGKEIADKIVKGEGKQSKYYRATGRRELSGVDLKVGGEGMKGFYDKILPSEVQKYVKQWGGEVKKSGFGKKTTATDKSQLAEVSREEAGRAWRNGENVFAGVTAEFGTSYRQIGEANRGISEADMFGMNPGPYFVSTGKAVYETPIWRVDITPQMRESVQKTGQPRFMPSDTDYLAAVKAGDTQAAQQMVDQAAKAAGGVVIRKLKERSDLFWRVHGPELNRGGSQFSVDNASSSTLGGEETLPGYSSFKSADELADYWSGNNFASRRISDNDVQVIAFTGKQESKKGADGEPLATPDMREVYRMTFGDMLKGNKYSVNGKSADPITRDDSGNVIPLSQRFQQSSADIRYMPQPDPSVPGAYSVTGGFRILPGKTKGRMRVYGPAGSLVGIAGSLDEAQRMIQRKTR